MNKFYLSILILCFANQINAQQFILFDKEFTFEEKDAVPTKSHLRVTAEELNKGTPKDWTSPVNYSDGKVYIRLEVLGKPAGDVPTHWSLCYIGNKGQNGSMYAVAGSPRYTKPGVYEVTRDMKKLWQKDKVVWSEGLKAFTLVIKGPKLKDKPAGKSHAHLQPDLKKFFPAKIRLIMVQVAKGAKFDPSKVPAINKK